jgi:hypothetical protein
MGALGLLSADSAVVGDRKRCITSAAATQDCASDGNSDEETHADEDQEPPWVHWDRQATNYSDFWSQRAAAAAACGLSQKKCAVKMSRPCRASGTQGALCRQGDWLRTSKHIGPRLRRGVCRSMP